MTGHAIRVCLIPCPTCSAQREAERKALADRRTVEGWADGGNHYAYRCRGPRRHEVELRWADGHIMASCNHATADAAYSAAAEWARNQEGNQ